MATPRAQATTSRGARRAGDAAREDRLDEITILTLDCTSCGRDFGVIVELDQTMRDVELMCDALYGDPVICGDCQRTIQRGS